MTSGGLWVICELRSVQAAPDLEVQGGFSPVLWGCKSKEGKKSNIRRQKVSHV